MNQKYADFLESIDNENVKSVYRNPLKIINRQNLDLDTVEDKSVLDALFVNSQINSKNTLQILKNMIIEYSRFSDNKKLFTLVSQINIDDIWEMIRHKSRPVLLRYSDFEKIYNDLGYGKNGLYIQTLFRAVFEGICSNSLNVLINLRASDVHSNIVTLKESDEEIWNIEVSEVLARNLIEVSKNDKWERENIYGDFTIPIDGKFSDSVFKIEHRTGVTDKSYTRSYRLRFETITKYYIGYSVSLKNLYISGMIARITEKMEGLGLDLMTILEINDEIGMRIVKEELDRCHYKSPVGHFKKYVLSHNFIEKILI